MAEPIDPTAPVLGTGSDRRPIGASELADDGLPSAPKFGRLLSLMILPWIAMYAIFQGVQQILVPSQVEGLDPVHKIVNLAWLTTVSSCAAVIALPCGGGLSDVTRGRWGRRTPWLAGGALISAILLLTMSATRSMVVLGLVYSGLWLTINLYQGALTAVLPDRIPRERRGTASAILGLAPPIGLAVGVNVAANVSQGWGYGALAGLLLCLTALFVLGAREQPYPFAGEQATAGAASPAGSAGQSGGRFFSSLRHRDFRLAFASRAALFVAYFTVGGYWFYVLQDRVGAARLPHHDVKFSIGILSTVSTVFWLLSAVLAGWLADRLKRHKLIVGIASVGLGAAMIVPILAPTWPGMLLFAALNGGFFGTYMAVDLALMSLVLPNKATEGRDMGILAVATAAPQIISPLVAGGLIGWLGYDALFLFGALSAFAGGVLAFSIRSVR